MGVVALARRGSLLVAGKEHFVPGVLSSEFSGAIIDKPQFGLDLEFFVKQATDQYASIPLLLPLVKES